MVTTCRRGEGRLDVDGCGVDLTVAAAAGCVLDRHLRRARTAQSRDRNGSTLTRVLPGSIVISAPSSSSVANCFSAWIRWLAIAPRLTSSARICTTLGCLRGWRRGSRQSPSHVLVPRNCWLLRTPCFRCRVHSVPRHSTCELPQCLSRRALSANGATDSYQRLVSRFHQRNLTLFSSPCRVAQRLQDVLTFKIRVLGEQVIDGLSRTDLANDHAHCDTHAANAGFAAHDIRLQCDAIEVVHMLVRRYAAKLIAAVLGLI